MTILLRYDFAIIRNNARSAFTRKRDWLPFLVGLPILAAIMVQTSRDGSLGRASLPLLVVLGGAGVIALAVGSAIGRRLDHLKQDSMVAPAALERRGQVEYYLFWHLPALALAGTAGAVFGAPLMLVGAAYGAGAVLPLVANPRRLAAGAVDLRAVRATPMTAEAKSWRGRIAQLLVRRSGFAGLSVPLNLLLLAGAGMVAALPYLVSRTTDGLAATAAAVLVLLAWLSRQHPPLWRYLLAVGQGPLPLALVPAGLAAVALVPVLILLGLAGAGSWGALAATCGGALILFAFVTAIRAYHYAIRPRGLADLAFQLDLVALALTGLLTWGLAPVLAAVRMVMLHRRARSMRYLLA